MFEYNKYFTIRNSEKFAIFFIFLYLTDGRGARKFVKILRKLLGCLLLKCYINYSYRTFCLEIIHITTRNCRKYAIFVIFLCYRPPVGPKILEIFKISARCLTFKMTYDLYPQDYLFGNSKFLRNSRKYDILRIFVCQRPSGAQILKKKIRGELDVLLLK